MNPKLVVAIIAAVLIAAAVAAYFLLLRQPAPSPVVIPLPSLTPSPSSSLAPTDQIATLKTEPGITGSGEASRSATPGRFVLTVTAELPDPGEGKFYEVWLVRPDPAGQFSIGQLKKSGDRWVLTLDQTRDASVYSNVMVTQETVDDKKPETKVLTGSF